MKILVDVRKLSRKPSGIGLYVYNFLNSIINSDIEIILVSDVIESCQLKELKSKGIEILCFGSQVDKNIGVFSYFKYIQRIINDIKPNIFWEPNNIIPIKLKNPHGKIMVTIHDIFPITSKEHYGFAYRNYFNLSIKKTIKVSDALVYVSKETKNEVEKRFENARSKLNFISYNIVEVENCNMAEIKDNSYFLFVGNLEKRKGIDLLLKAFDLYINEGGGKQLYIAGALRDQTIKSMIDKVNEQKECIKYFGYINNEEKEKLLSECSVFVFPSRAEGFGIPPIEALIYKKPCIVSNLNIFREILGESVNYFDIVENEKDTVINLMNVLSDYSTLDIKKANEIVSEYTSNRLTKNFINFIQGL